MASDPIVLALRHINETRQMLDALITSSESFDYPKAKLALQALDRKSRDLARLSAKLAAPASGALPNVIHFPLAQSRPDHRR